MPKNKFTKELENKIVELYKSGFSSSKLSKEYSTNSFHILNILKRSGIKRRGISECHRKYSINENYFEKIDSHEKAQILGFICADGYNAEKRYAIVISILETDRSYLENILKCLGSNSTIKLRKKTKKEHKTLASILICNVKISKDLAKLSCVQKKSLILNFPSNLIVPDEFISSFLLGYFDGDGMIYKVKKNSLHGYVFGLCGTYEFCQKAEEIFKTKFGAESKIKKNTPTDANAYALTVCNRKSILQILTWMYSQKSFVLERKYKIYLNLIESEKIMRQKDADRKRKYKLINDMKNKGYLIREIAKESGFTHGYINALFKGKIKIWNEWLLN